MLTADEKKQISDFLNTLRPDQLRYLVGYAGGKLSRRTISPAQQKAMQLARQLKKEERRHE